MRSSNNRPDPKLNNSNHPNHNQTSAKSPLRQTSTAATAIIAENKSGFVNQKMQRFFAKRAPRRDAVTLTLRNVYIFFSQEGGLYALLLAITFIAGINYGNNLVLGLCFYLFSVWIVSLHVTFSHIYGLHLERQDAPLVQAQQIGWVTINIINNKSKPSRQVQLMFDHQQAQQTDDTIPQWKSLGIYPKHTLISLLGRQRVTLPVMTHRRGRLPLPRLIVSTVYPLGIMRAWAYVYFATPIWVYPKPQPFDLQAVNRVPSQELQEVSHNVNEGQHDFESLDEYTEGESLARVSWAHVARGQGMLTKHFSDPVGQERLLDYSDMPSSNHEERLAQLTYAVLQLAETGDAFQLNLPNDVGQLGAGNAFLNACLLRLAQCP